MSLVIRECSTPEHRTCPLSSHIIRVHIASPNHSNVVTRLDSTTYTAYCPPFTVSCPPFIDITHPPLPPSTPYCSEFATTDHRTWKLTLPKLRTHRCHTAYMSQD